MVTTTAEEWDKKSEALLREWKEKCSGYRWLHNHARFHHKSISDWLSYPSIIIASATGVGGFAFMNPTGNDETPDNIRWFQLVFATLNVIGGILTSVNKFSQSASLVEKHSIASIAYSKLYRAIDMELTLDPEHRQQKSIAELVRSFREHYDRLLDESPDLPCKSIIAFQKKFVNDHRAKPEVTNGLSPVIKDVNLTPEQSVRSVLMRWKDSVVNRPRHQVTLSPGVSV
jgi:hypothetical protein